ncbi:MAG: imidazolonepropionase [Paludibacter sp.]|jgi:imidazolonepropionase|nr:imidazolonepropionase [Paludibacter sp.]
MKLTGPFIQILTMDKLPLRGKIADEQLEIVPNGGIAYQDGKIVEIGDFKLLQQKYPSATLDLLTENYVALPAMIDVHTHICWAGSRAKDYAMRLSGKSYLEIATAGGGIWDTVSKTRQCLLAELARLTAERANALYAQGIHTIEVKSGYGLSLAEELKMLEAIHLANEQTNADLIPTCLAAHIVPKDFAGNETDYLEMLASELLPEIKRRKLTNRVDVFVEKTAFSVDAATKYLLKAKDLGFDILLHGDQFTASSAGLARQVGALSIDHLEAADENEISILASGSTIPVALPGASLGLGDKFAPARKLLDAGTSLVIASDWNPGSAPMGDLLTQAAILGAAQKLSMAETWAALTCRAAAALNLHDRGILKNGYQADFIMFKTNDYSEILYRQGRLMVNG